MILGIGLSKTGTRSLNEALKILGYNAVHFPSKNQLFSGEYDAFTDIPTIVYFDRLIEKYPDAIIINTDRDYAAWVYSALKHFQARTNNSYVKYIREQVYKSDMPCCGYLREAYHRHQDFVFSLPKYLNLNVEHKNKWELLCGWLEKDKPDVSYPWIR